MPYHYWGDGFDFGGLEKAADRLARVYKRITNKEMLWKEKYGTIRYELTCMWLENKQDVDVFIKCLKWIIKKEPQFAGELVDDAAYMFLDENFCSFFKGVVYLHDILNPAQYEEV